MEETELVNKDIGQRQENEEIEEVVVVEPVSLYILETDPDIEQPEKETHSEVEPKVQQVGRSKEMNASEDQTRDPKRHHMIIIEQHGHLEAKLDKEKDTQVKIDLPHTLNEVVEKEDHCRDHEHVVHVVHQHERREGEGNQEDQQQEHEVIPVLVKRVFEVDVTAEVMT